MAAALAMGCRPTEAATAATGNAQANADATQWSCGAVHGEARLARALGHGGRLKLGALADSNGTAPATMANLERLARVFSEEHMRPIRESDVDVDYPAVMGSRERLWRKYGGAWEWPAVTLSYDADRVDLARHEDEIARHETFNYAILDRDEVELLGCVYVDPPDSRSPPGSDAVASWWVVDRMVGSELERFLDDFIPGWLRDAWGFNVVHYLPEP